MTQKLEAQIVGWITDTVGSADNVSIDLSTQIAKQHLLDSLQIMDLVMFLEKENNIKIPLEALTETNFRTPASIMAMVESVLSAG